MIRHVLLRVPGDMCMCLVGVRDRAFVVVCRPLFLCCLLLPRMFDSCLVSLCFLGPRVGSFPGMILARRMLYLWQMLSLP